jgi:hypothetical protein
MELSVTMDKIEPASHRNGGYSTRFSTVLG